MKTRKRIIKIKVYDVGFVVHKRTGCRYIYHEMVSGWYQIRKPRHVGNNPHDPSKLIKTITKRQFHEEYSYEDASSVQTELGKLLK